MSNLIRTDAVVWAAGLKNDGARKIGASLTMFLPLHRRDLKLEAANVNGCHSVDDAYSTGADLTFGHQGGYARFGKRALDLFVILVALPAVVLVVGICALALWIEGGQPFYRQERLGRNGKRFQIFKLRTMVRDADEKMAALLASDPELRAEWNTTQKLKKDPRITRIGGMLRRTSLDELPQLWNVVRGEMSLIGPRPMLPEQLPLYGNHAYYYDLEPGITGIWQVSARNESSFAHRFETDAQYHQELSLSLDLKLLLKTVGVVFRGTGY